MEQLRPLDGGAADMQAVVMKSLPQGAAGMRGAGAFILGLAVGNLLWPLAFAAGQDAVRAIDAAPKATQRASGLDESLTLLEVVGAFAAADRSTEPVSDAEKKRLEKYIRTAPDAICPLVAEDTLRLKQPWLWPNLVRRSFAEWAGMDGAAAMRRVETIQDAERREAAFEVTHQVWMQRQPEQYWAWLLKYPDEAKREKLVEKFVEWRALNDLPAAVKMLPEIKHPATRENAMDEIAWKWGEKDPQAALAWVGSLGSSVNPYRLTRRVVLGLTSKNKEAGAALAMSLPDAGMRGNLVNEVHQVWSNFDVRAAMNSFLKLPAGFQHSATGGSLGFNTEKMTVEKILAMDQELAPLKEVRVRFLVSAASRKEDAGRMQDALALLHKLEEGDARRDSMRRLATNWALRDVAAASAWVEHLPDGADREAAVEGVAWGMLKADPQRALSWSERLKDERAAQVLQENLLFNWWRVDEKNARQWLTQTKSFTEEEKPRVLKETEMMSLLKLAR